MAHDLPWLVKNWCCQARGDLSKMMRTGRRAPRCESDDAGPSRVGRRHSTSGRVAANHACTLEAAESESIPRADGRGTGPKLERRTLGAAPFSHAGPLRPLLSARLQREVGRRRPEMRVLWCWWSLTRRSRHCDVGALAAANCMRSNVVTATRKANPPKRMERGLVPTGGVLRRSRIGHGGEDGSRRYAGGRRRTSDSLIRSTSALDRNPNAKPSPGGDLHPAAQ